MEGARTAQRAPIERLAPTTAARSDEGVVIPIVGETAENARIGTCGNFGLRLRRLGNEEQSLRVLGLWRSW